MPRPPRLLLSKSYYHIIARGNNRSTIFRLKKDYLYYLNLIMRFKSELPFDLFHYCLMPNHIHFLIRTKNANNFSLFMKKINLAYFHYFNREYGWSGHFWQDRFRSQPVGKDEYFLQCGKYIELNPVRAKLVLNPENWIFSSYRLYILGESNSLITKDPFYIEFGKNKVERQQNYQKMIIEEFINESYNKNVWGSSVQRYLETKKITNSLETPQRK